MAEFDNYTEILQKVWKEIPDEVKGVAPGVLASTYSAIKNSLQHCSAHDKLTSLMEYLTTSATASKEEVTKLVDGMKDTFPTIADKSEEICTAAQHAGPANDTLVDCVDAAMTKCADSALKSACIASFVSLAAEAYRLHGFWNEICAAKIFLKEEFDQKKAAIQEQLDALPAKLTKFAKGLHESLFQDFDSDQRLCFFLKKSKRYEALRSIISGIRNEICDLKCTVDGKIQVLSARRDATAGAVIGQVIQGGSQLANLSIFGDFASTGMQWLSIGAVLCHGAAIGMGLAAHRSAGEIIKELRKKLLDIQQLTCYLDKHQRKLTAIFLDFQKKIKTGPDSDSE